MVANAGFPNSPNQKPYSYGVQIAGFFAPLVSMLLILLVSPNLPIPTSFTWYKVFLAANVSVSVIVASITFARYYARKNSAVVFIGLAFVSSAVLNSIQLLALSDLHIIQVNQIDSTLIHWGWLTSQILWASLLCLSVILWYLRNRFGQKAEVRSGVVYIYVGLLTVAAAVFFTSVPLPEPYVNLRYLPRPTDIIPAVILAITILGYLGKGKWRHNPFDYWLITGMIFTLCSHLLFMSQSHAVYDQFFYLAHSYEDVGVLCVAVGMLHSISLLFREAEQEETELRDRFQEMRRGKAVDDAMIESIGDGLIVTDSDTRIVKVNTAFEIMTGHNGMEIIGEPVTKIVPMLDKDGKEVPYEHRAQAMALFAGQRVALDMNYSYRRKNGTAFAVSSTVNPIILDGEVIGAIEIFRDVTRERLIDEQKSTFVSVASHQLRTPLTTLNWYTEMLLSGDAGPINKDQKEYLDEIYQGTQRLVILVNELLNVSRIESGRMRIDPKPTDISKLIQVAIKEVVPLLQGRDVEIVYTPNTLFTNMLVDEGLYMQVVHNLLTNAIRYSPHQNKSVVKIELKQKQFGVTETAASPIKPGNYMLLSVTDHGIGIPKDQHNKIFQKFFRAENAILAAADGNGLGLYFVKMILNEAGGDIWFDSVERKGTTFYVAIPLTGMQKKDGAKGVSVIH